MRLKPRLASLRREVLSQPPEFGVLVAIFAFAAAIFTFLKFLNEMREGEAHGADQIILLALCAPNDPSNPIGPQWLESVCRDLTTYKGKKLTDAKDAKGFAFGQKIMRTVSSGKISEITYMWPGPDSDTPVQKTTLFTKVGDQICAVGYYK
jgi:hypothetical protein